MRGVACACRVRPGPPRCVWLAPHKSCSIQDASHSKLLNVPLTSTFVRLRVGWGRRPGPACPFPPWPRAKCPWCRKGPEEAPACPQRAQPDQLPRWSRGPHYTPCSYQSSLLRADHGPGRGPRTHYPSRPNVGSRTGPSMENLGCSPPGEAPPSGQVDTGTVAGRLGDGWCGGPGVFSLTVGELSEGLRGVARP